MRTTLDLDKPVLEKLKKLQQKERRSMSKIASTLLAEALAGREVPGGKRAAPELDWSSTNMKARVDLADKEALYRALDRS